VSNANAGYAGANEAIPVSPCDDAYHKLVEASEEHERLLDGLIDRLNPAMRAAPPPNDSKPGPVAATDMVHSELHGRLLGTAKRVQQQNTAQREVLGRLTI
jgi:hypothetical protein